MAGLIVGDIVFFKGQTWVSKVVAELTGSPYTHVGVAFSDSTVLEADRFIKARVRNLNDFDIYTVMRCELSAEQRRSILINGTNFIGTKYDYLEIAKWFFKLTTNIEGHGLVNNANRVYCSELVDFLFKSVGVDLVPDRVDGDVLPVHLLNSPLLTRIK
jgi:hypothetical protein